VLAGRGKKPETTALKTFDFICYFYPRPLKGFEGTSDNYLAKLLLVKKFSAMPGNI
jgi:hypothetical protein